MTGQMFQALLKMCINQDKHNILKQMPMKGGVSLLLFPSVYIDHVMCPCFMFHLQYTRHREFVRPET